MPKLERLLKLARVTRGPRAITVKEMSKLCGVSQRTIFRYRKELAELNLPDGLRIDDSKTTNELPGKVLDPDDQCLLCFVLEHNPLVKYGYLAGRLNQIKKMLSGGHVPKGRVIRGSFIEVDQSSVVPTKHSGDRILPTFVAACRSGKPLLVEVRNRDGDLALRPHSIKIKSSGVKLSFRALFKGQPRTLDLDKILSVRFVGSLD